MHIVGGYLASIDCQELKSTSASQRFMVRSRAVRVAPSFYVWEFYAQWRDPSSSTDSKGVPDSGVTLEEVTVEAYAAPPGTRVVRRPVTPDAIVTGQRMRASARPTPCAVDRH